MRRKENEANISMYSIRLDYGLRKYDCILLFWQSYLIPMAIMAWGMLSFANSCNLIK